MSFCCAVLLRKPKHPPVCRNNAVHDSVHNSPTFVTLASRLIQFTPSRHISITRVLKLFLSLSFQTRILYAFLFCPVRSTRKPNVTLLHSITLVAYRKDCNVSSFVMTADSHSHHFVTTTKCLSLAPRTAALSLQSLHPPGHRVKAAMLRDAMQQAAIVMESEDFRRDLMFLQFIAFVLAVSRINSYCDRVTGDRSWSETGCASLTSLRNCCCALRGLSLAPS